MANLDFHSHHKKLLEEYKSLKEDYSELILERDNALISKIPFYEALFIRKLGYLLHQVFELDTKIAMLKLKIDLITASINRNESPNISKIDEEIHTYYQTQLKQLEDQAKDIELAKQKEKDALLSEEESRASKMYKALVKKFHPDLNPNLPPELKDRFNYVQKLYEMQAWDLIEDLYLKVQLDETYAPDTDIDLAKQIDFIQKKIKVIREQLTAIYAQYPLKFIDLLEDEEMLKEEQEKLQKEIEEKTLHLNYLESKLSLIVT